MSQEFTLISLIKFVLLYLVSFCLGYYSRDIEKKIVQVFNMLKKAIKKQKS